MGGMHGESEEHACVVVGMPVELGVFLGARCLPGSWVSALGVGCLPNNWIKLNPRYSSRAHSKVDWARIAPHPHTPTRYPYQQPRALDEPSGPQWALKGERGPVGLACQFASLSKCKLSIFRAFGVIKQFHFDFSWVEPAWGLRWHSSAPKGSLGSPWGPMGPDPDLNRPWALVHWSQALGPDAGLCSTGSNALGP